MNEADEMKAASRGASRDMSPAAIAHRFGILVELDRTARALRAVRTGPARTSAAARRTGTATSGEG